MLTARLDSLWPQWRAWIAITRLDKPVGSYLLLWPTFWALWTAAEGMPSLSNLIIFTAGVFLMRSAGCVINDYADREVDGHVKRTNDRPLATGALSAKAALVGFALLCALSFGLVLLTNSMTVWLSFGGVALAAIYPFMKRHTHLPQLFLGAAFSWAIPMAFAAESETLPAYLWLFYAANLCWTVAYDTFYAMVDRDDDLKIGVKSTAILWGRYDRAVIGVFQLLFFALLIAVGGAFELGWLYYLGLAGGAAMAVNHQWLARRRERDACFRAFMQHNILGGVIFAGVVADLAIR